MTETIDPGRMPFVVLLYDLDESALRRHMPRGGSDRWLLIAYFRPAGALFSHVVWIAKAPTQETALALVPGGGERFDCSRNWPSPMVPVEGWGYEVVMPAPPASPAPLADLPTTPPSSAPSR